MSAALTTLRVTRDGPVARLILARADKRNALSAAMLEELREAASSLGADAGVRVVVLQAEGEIFCAGGDLDWMRAQMVGDDAGRIAAAHALSDMLRALWTLPKPLIARVQGPAYGGGVGLLSVCDGVIAAEEAHFALTETRLGLIPATIAPYVLARLTPNAGARLFASGRRFGAVAAREAGLVTVVAPAAALDRAVEEEVAPWLDCAPGAVAAGKALQRRLRPVDDPSVVQITIDALVERWESEEAQTGVAAFFDRRRPPWRDR